MVSELAQDKMGRYRNARTRTTKNKDSKKGCKTHCRSRDIDQIQDDMEKVVETKAPKEFELDEDLPGMGQHYCLTCGRHFANEITLVQHRKTKIHKRRLLVVAKPKYTHDEAMLASGKTIEKLPPAHPVK